MHFSLTGLQMAFSRRKQETWFPCLGLAIIETWSRNAHFSPCRFLPENADISVRYLINLLLTYMCWAKAAGTHHSTTFSREEQLDERTHAASFFNQVRLKSE